MVVVVVVVYNHNCTAVLFIIVLSSRLAIVQDHVVTDAVCNIM